MLLKLVIMIVVTIVCATPVTLFFWFKSFIVPVGFWQTFIFYGAGLYIGGAMQFGLIVFWLAVLLFLIFHKDQQKYKPWS